MCQSSQKVRVSASRFLWRASAGRAFILSKTIYGSYLWSSVIGEDQLPTANRAVIRRGDALKEAVTSAPRCGKIADSFKGCIEVSPEEPKQLWPFIPKG